MMFNIQLGDVVCFKHVENKVEEKMEEDVPREEQEDEKNNGEAYNNFEFTIYRVVDNRKQKKDIVSMHGNIAKHNFL